MARQMCPLTRTIPLKGDSRRGRRHHYLVYGTKEPTHVTARAAAHFPMPPPPPPCHVNVMVARPAQVTQVTQVPITLTQHDTAAAPCDTTHPMWRHRGTARPEPPPPSPSPSPPPPPWLGKLRSALSRLRRQVWDAAF